MKPVSFLAWEIPIVERLRTCRFHFKSSRTRGVEGYVRVREQAKYKFG
jgi:hypothetical protein